jgi:hypothetical protein
VTVLAEDAASLSRRIDELLSGAIDEQVREQRAINELMVSVRDGISRLVGDMAALSARVTESRETSQGLREELPFLVQNEVTAATNTLAQRIDVLESAIGELAGGQSSLEDKLAPDLIIAGVSAKLAELRAAAEETAGQGAADAARDAVGAAATDMKGAFDDAASSLREAIDKQFAQMSRRLADAKTQADDLDERFGELAGALAVTARLPGDMADTVGRLTSEVEQQTTSVVAEVRDAAGEAAALLQRTVGGIERAANDMNKRFSEMSARMASFQEQILAYLQVRDVALEEKRDQIVSEILDDYLRTVPAKERGGAIQNLREAFRRRRDRKDAGKYREATADQPRLPQVPPAAVDRAVADLVRETGDAVAKRSAPMRREPRAVVPAPAPSPAPLVEEPKPSSEPELIIADDPGPLVLEESPPKPKRSPPPKPVKAVSKSPARSSKKKSGEAASSAAPAVEAMPAGEISPLDISSVETLDEGIGPIEAEAADSLAAELLGATRDEPAPEAAAPKAKSRRVVPAPKQAKSSSKKKTPKAVDPWEPPSDADEWEPVGVQPGPPPVPAEAEPAAEAPDTPAEADAAPGVPRDDTLAQALARVEALVAQHREPGGRRKAAASKPPAKKPKKAD